MEILRKVRYLGIYRGIYKLVYDNGYYWGRHSHYAQDPLIELKINEFRKMLNRLYTDELIQFKPEDLSEVE